MAFKDFSTNNFQLTAFGNAQISTSVKKYGNGSAYFDGSGDYLQTINSNEFNFGNGPFTIEMWVNPNATQIAGPGGSGNAGAFVSTRIGPVYAPLEFSIRDNLKIQILVESIGGNSWQGPIISNTTLVANTWSHIALVYDGTNTKLYINGILDSNFTNITFAYKNQNNIIYIGKGGDGDFNGYIDDLRITKGIARYTSNFTPPQQQLPAPSDPYQDNVSLLLHMDGTNGSQTFTDSSSNNFTLSAFGDAQISTSVKKFGSGAAYFDGNGDYLDLPVNAIQFNADDFTIEFWVHPTRTGSHTCVANWNCSNLRTIFFAVDTSAGVVVYLNGAGPFITGGSIQVNQWQHVALVRQGSDMRAYINGVQAGNTYNIGNTAINTIVDNIRIGRDTASFNCNQPLEGYIDELRITKGVARYTSNFVPHTAPFANPPRIPSGYLAFWKLADLTDSSPNGNNLINTNNVQFVQGKIGDCAEFASSKYLSTNINWNVVQNDWSVSFWMFPTSTPANVNTFPLVADNIAGTWLIQYLPSLEIGFSYVASSPLLGPAPLNTWTHVAATKSSAGLKLYINGILQGTSTYIGTINPTIFRMNTEFTDQVYTGKLDAVGIWQRELTQSEIDALYNNGNGREP